MLNVRLAGDHLSLVMSFIASFCAVLFPRDVLDEIWDLIESVSEGFPTYSCHHVNEDPLLWAI